MTLRELVRIPLAMTIGTALHIFVASGTAFLVVKNMTGLAALLAYSFYRGVIYYVVDPSSCGLICVVPWYFLYWMHTRLAIKRTTRGPIRGRTVLKDWELPWDRTRRSDPFEQRGKR